MSATIRSRKKRTVEIDNFILKCVKGGMLKEKDGCKAIRGALREQWPQTKLRKENFLDRILRVFWEHDKTDNTVRDMVRDGVENGEKIFSQMYPYMPMEFIKDKFKWHRGVSGSECSGETDFIKGICRIEIDPVPMKQLPKATSKRPYCIKTKKPNWSILNINGSNIGTLYPGDIVGNVSRRALSEASHFGDDVVILTNILCMDIKKAASTGKAKRARVMGDDVNTKLIQDEEYREEADDIVDNSPTDNVLCMIPEENLRDLMSGWKKILTKPPKERSGPSDKYEFNGPILVVLGMNEADFIHQITAGEINWQLKRQRNLVTEALSNQRAYRKKVEKEFGDTTEIDKNIENLEKRLYRLRVTNVKSREYKRFYARVYSTFVRIVQESIPNSVVIGKGTSYIRINDKLIKITIPSHIRITDNHLVNTANESISSLDDKRIDCNVCCHPFSPHFREVAREVDYDGIRKSQKVAVSPIAVDGKFIISNIDSTDYTSHPLAKTVSRIDFHPGVMRIQCVSDAVDVYPIAVEALESYKTRKVPTKGTKKASIYPKYIWIMSCSDPHWGSRHKEYLIHHKTDKHFGIAESVFQMMRDANLVRNIPVHLYAVPDDPTQGQNHEYRTEPHPEQIPDEEIEKMSLDIIEQAKFQEVVDFNALREIHNLFMSQLERRGSDNILIQMFQMINRHIDPNIDIFRAILKRSMRSGLTIKGVSRHTKYGFDSRDLGIINYGSGNHLTNTLGGEMTEGIFYAQKTRDLLMRYPEWRNKENKLKQLIVAPSFGTTTVGWGIVSVPGGHEYGLEMRSAPTRMSSWGDTLLGHTRNDKMRSNYSRIFNNKLPVVKIMGDKHFLCTASTRYAFYHMTPPGVVSCPYSQRGFPPNNTGVSFIGLPVGGPEEGPIIVRSLMYEVIKYYIESENPKPFNWDEFLPNPV